MKVNLNRIKSHALTELSVDALVQKIGAQLGAVETVQSLGDQYQGIIVARIVSCQKHPNADRLNVCLIDDGGKAVNVARDDNGLVQVVCGAPNVREGLLVVWLPPGSTVPSSFNGDPFVLEARELRGVISNGMLASYQELDLSDDHTGIVELTAAEPGDDFAERFQLNDYIIDIENKMFTHRPDCFGLLGVAREVAGITQSDFVDDYMQFEKDYQKPLPSGLDDADKDMITIKNELPELVQRFMAQLFTDVTVRPSDIELQIMMKKIGMRSINNVVDITNYVMHFTGQPIHAYDYDKVAALSNDSKAHFVIRRPYEEESLTLLNGKTIKPRKEAILIATDQTAIGLGGVMGGQNTEVDASTTRVIIECANFDMYNIRRTSMEHGLFTDAVTRFNKGQSPLQNPYVLNYAAILMVVCGATGHVGVGKSIHDAHGLLPEPETVTISTTFINARLGLALEAVYIQSLLQRVGFTVDIGAEELTITAPHWRMDIGIAEDIVEEVGRLHGFDTMPLDLPLRSIVPVPQNQLIKIKQHLRSALASYGANELLTYSFVHGNLLKNTGQDSALAFALTNALSPDLQYYRLSLTPSLLARVNPNIRSGYDSFTLFEIGKFHDNFHIDDAIPREFQSLALVTTHKKADAGYGFYQAKAYLNALGDSLGIDFGYQIIGQPADAPIVKPFESDRSAYITIGADNEPIGIIGEYTAAVRKRMKLPVGSGGFELDIELLANHYGKASGYRQLSKFPHIAQDICLQVPASTAFSTVATALQASIANHASTAEIVDIQPIDIYSAENLEGQKRLTFRITLTSYERTLSESVLTTMLDATSSELHQSIGSTRI